MWLEYSSIFLVTLQYTFTQVGYNGHFHARLPYNEHVNVRWQFAFSIAIMAGQKEEEVVAILRSQTYPTILETLPAEKEWPRSRCCRWERKGKHGLPIPHFMDFIIHT